MTRHCDVRRHADGALDIDHYRRRAKRLRAMARRRAWSGLHRRLATLASWLLAGRLQPRARVAPIGAMAAIVLAGAVRAEEWRRPPEQFTATILHAAPLVATQGRIIRLYRIELGARGQTAAAMPSGDEIVMLVAGEVAIQVAGDHPRRLHPGQVVQHVPMMPHTIRNTSATMPATLIVGSISAIGEPGSIPLAATD